MSTLTLAWLAIGLYIALVAFLAYKGWKKSKTLDSYAVGAKDISPIVVGLSLSASLTSVATFVTNPGLVFVYGTSALLGFGVAAALGITLGLVFFSKAFRTFGTTVQALTVPQWIGTRYNSKPLSIGFAFLSLALITFAVLIVVALAHVLHQLLHIDKTYIIIGLIMIVFTYVMFGGVNTHAYTNAIQAVVMIIVAIILIASGVHTFFEEPGLVESVRKIDANLMKAVNPKSLYFRNWFEAFFCNFLIGLALICQPHTLSKTLYLKDNKDIRKFLATAVVVGGLFAMVMIVGLFARKLYNADILQSIAKTRSFDVVVATYIDKGFVGGLKVFVSMGILFAGLSTLEGILLGVSTIISADLYLGIFSTNVLKNKTLEEKKSSALKVGRISYLFIAIITFFLAQWQIKNPTGGSVVIFAMFFLYVLTSASLVPIMAGMFIKNSKRIAVTVAAGTAVIVYTIFFFFKITYMYNNPAFLGAMSIMSALVMFSIFQWLIPVGKDETKVEA